MKKTLLIPLLFFGCQAESDPNDVWRASLPPRDGLDVSVPGGAGSGGAGVHREALIGQVADLYAVTRRVSANLNGLVGGVLHSIWDLAQNPPTAADADHAVWGPITDPLSPVVARLVAYRDHFQLDVRAKTAGDDTFQPFVIGVPGEFHVDLTLMNALDPVGQPQPGELGVQYGPGLIRVHLDGLDYQFTPGTLQFANAGMQIFSRWNGSGAGRADADGRITECWDAAFRRVFFTDGTNAEGSAQSCVF